MLKKLVFMRGLPGSSKSTHAHELKAKHHDSCWIFATDDYWMRPDGVYDFNLDLIGESHAWNQKRTNAIMEAERVQQWDSIIVIDNTNITFDEMKPYIKMALKHGFEIEFVEPDTEWKYDVEECYTRNTHGVPYSTILRMYNEWEDHETVMKKFMGLK